MESARGIYIVVHSPKVVVRDLIPYSVHRDYSVHIIGHSRFFASVTGHGIVNAGLFQILLGKLIVNTVVSPDLFGVHDIVQTISYAHSTGVDLIQYAVIAIIRKDVQPRKMIG